jgi:chromosome segregation protein
MSAPARLLSVRLQGFKSFAERTLVTFGPGISAVVGPNGSGKSNLADALRWALGEQGRALRSRKAEDVIWAGSERRAAVGMADVQLTLDNGDGLLAVEYGVVELGRRLYRSGENEYLLNRQPVRLRDLVDLLDGAHLAENAFLFIGQGMVDQALALRPEERRPLFEEVAGVRRHERRRRRAEEQLAESEANIARVEDILAELRPQARRLGVQAEQQTTRTSAGDELATALLLAAHARWHAMAARIGDASDRLGKARADVDAALGDLTSVESATAAVAAALGERAASATALRRRVDEAREALTAAQLREGLLTSEALAIARDRERLAGERAAADADLAIQRRRLAEPVPVRDLEAEAALSAAERSHADALAELAALRVVSQARDADLAGVRRAATARSAEMETARRRLAEAERAAAAERTRAGEGAARLGEAEAARSAASAELERATATERAASATREAAESALENRAAEARAAAERAAEASASVGGLRAQYVARAAGIADDAGSGIAARLRSRGGRRIDHDLAVEPGFRPAVDAALAGAARAYVSTHHALLELAGERGIAVVSDAGSADGGAAPDGGATQPETIAFRDRLTAAGGGLLADGLRRDGTGLARRVLGRAAWTPDLATAFALQQYLPPGWILVPRDGTAVVGEIVVRLGTGERVLESRAELERVQAELRGAEAAADAAAASATGAARTAGTARTELDTARAAESGATSARRAAEESERISARQLEAFVREAGWHAAQAARLAAEVERARSAIPGDPPRATGPEAPGVERDALATWEARAVELRARRDRLAGVVTEVEDARREAERRRAGAEASIAMDEARIVTADLAAARLGEREGALSAERAAHAATLADGAVRESEARAALEGLLTADADDRARLADAEGAAGAARERLRAAEERSRTEERRDLEARLGQDALREQLLVELAGLGRLGLVHLEAVAGTPVSRDRPDPPSASSTGRGDGAGGSDEPDAEDESDEGALLAAALDSAGLLWAATPPPEAPGPGRLAALRRRYHELGAANPYAVEEYAAVRARLDDLERQHDDLRTAIARTRALILELDGLISEQFRATFRALEASFDARFRQLFGGGFARLSLTDPSDLAATGVEIVARPPGKKPQALTMLSGGERALTAVALLFAMLEVRPVPFCVLDEVDAALDEANVGRFTTALREDAARVDAAGLSADHAAEDSTLDPEDAP